MEETNQLKGRKIWFLPQNVLSLIQLYGSYALVPATCHHSMIEHNVLNVHLGITLHVVQMI